MCEVNFMSNLDNAKLKELMKIEPESMSKKEYESFVYEFKNAQLFCFLLKYILKLKVMK